MNIMIIIVLGQISFTAILHKINYSTYIIAFVKHMAQIDGVQYSKDPLDSCCGYSSQAILQTRFFLWWFQSFSPRIFWTSLICTKNKRLTFSFSPVFHSLFNSHGSPTLYAFSFVSCVCEVLGHVHAPHFVMPIFHSQTSHNPKSQCYPASPAPCHHHLKTKHLSLAALLIL